MVIVVVEIREGRRPAQQSIYVGLNGIGWDSMGWMEGDDTLRLRCYGMSGGSGGSMDDAGGYAGLSWSPGPAGAWTPSITAQKRPLPGRKEKPLARVMTVRLYCTCQRDICNTGALSLSGNFSSLVRGTIVCMPRYSPRTAVVCCLSGPNGATESDAAWSFRGCHCTVACAEVLRLEGSIRHTSTQRTVGFPSSPMWQVGHSALFHSYSLGEE